ncbi:MAG: sigma-54 dependent transcriptional regulator [Myxococcota bacterium]
MPRILVCDDEASLRDMLRVLLRRAGHDVTTAKGVRDALQKLAVEAPFDIVVTDLLMPDGSGMEVLRAAGERDANTQVVMITAYATTAQAVEAMREGAYDYVQKPFRNEALRATIDKALEKRSILAENQALREEMRSSQERAGLVGKSDAMQRVMSIVARVAGAPTSVLVTGESGTGKEMLARALHSESGRRDKNFVAVNCGALPEALMESELFGHQKGAFTGAVSAEEGLFRSADGGTIFLDEIGELPANLQVKMLRVLQERTVRPVGGKSEVPVDVRVIAATNRNLDEMVEEGSFRQDLFYRLNVIRIELPPLRQRIEDVPLLAQHFLRRYAALHRKPLSFAPEALHRIGQHSFPGNVRELENLVERAVTFARGSVIEADDLASPTPNEALAPAAPTTLPEEGLNLDAHLETVERALLLSALERSDGVRTNAAKLLGMSFRSFRYRLAKYGLGDD